MTSKEGVCPGPTVLRCIISTCFALLPDSVLWGERAFPGPLSTRLRCCLTAETRCTPQMAETITVLNHRLSSLQGELMSEQENAGQVRWSPLVARHRSDACCLSRAYACIHRLCAVGGECAAYAVKARV